MDILNKIEKLIQEGGGGSVTVTWRLCDPKDWSGDTCEEIQFDLDYYYEPDDPSVGIREDVYVEEVKFSQNAMFMGKKYRYGQDFPKQLQKYVMDFIDPMPSSLKSKFKGREGWENFLQYTLDKKLRRQDVYKFRQMRYNDGYC